MNLTEADLTRFKLEAFQTEEQCLRKYSDQTQLQIARAWALVSYCAHALLQDQGGIAAVATKLDGPNTAELVEILHLQRGSTYFEQGDYKKALETYALVADGKVGAGTDFQRKNAENYISSVHKAMAKEK